MNKKELLLLKEITEAFGPTGSEEKIRAIIKREIKDLADEMYVDPMGNLIAVCGQNNGILYAAHMDEIGFMITGICRDGSLRFSHIGHVSPGFLPSKRLIFESGLTGVISAKPYHLLGDEKKTPSYEEMRIYIGAESKEEAERLVSVGDCAVFDAKTDLVLSSDSYLYGKAMDNRLGCYLLIRLIQSGLKGGVFAFTVQEETGLRGAYAVAEEIPFQYGVALDTTTPSDIPGVVGVDQVCKLGKGGVLSFLDGATIYDNEMIHTIFERLQAKKIPVQTKTRKSGGNDASALQKAGVGHKAISLSTPARYIHGPYSWVSVRDVEAMEAALKEIHAYLLERIEKEGISK